MKEEHFILHPIMALMCYFRILNDETVVHIINKNDKPISLDLNRFEELDLNGKVFKRYNYRKSGNLGQHYCN